VIELAFQEQRSVVVDNTNVTLQDRLILIDLGRRHGVTIIGYYFQPDVPNSRKRNMQRTGKRWYPTKQFLSQHINLRPPLMKKALIGYTTYV